MDRVEDTPVTLPGRKPRAETNGFSIEPTTDVRRKVATALHQAVGEDVEPDAVEKLGTLLTDILSAGNGGGDGGGHKAAQKTAKKQNYIAIVLMLLSGAGGVVGGYYALKAQATSNTHEVEHLKKLEPQVKANTEDIRLIKVDVSGINKSVGNINTSQTAIKKGIGELKAERVKGIEDELAEAKRKIRRLEDR